MIYLTKEQILQKIQENKTPYWVLYQLLSNGRHAQSPLDFNDPDNVQGSEDEKIISSVAKLESALDFYTQNTAPGNALYFYIMARPSKKSNGETAKFEYNIRVTKEAEQTPTVSNDNYGNNNVPPLGYIPKEVLEEKMSNIEERIQIAVREEALKQKERELERLEKELTERLAEVDKDAAVVQKGMKKAILEVVEGWSEIKSSNGGNLAGAAETPHEKAVEALAEYIYENTANEEEVKVLEKYLKRFVEKIHQQNGISEETT